MNAQLKPVPAFGVETCATVENEIVPLAQAHFAEVSHHPDIPIDLNVALYKKAEAAGLLRIFTIRLNGALVGYQVFTVAYSLHYRTSLQARMDTLYLDPLYRAGRLGLKFMMWCEGKLQAEGVQIVYVHGKFVKDIHKLYELMGYNEPVYYTYGKRLDGI